MRKNEFWWHIWACHSHFSRYRVFNCQNWIKILVFTNFFSLVTYYYFTTNKNGQSPKNSLVFWSGRPNCFTFLHVTLQGTLHIYLNYIIFRSYRFEDDFIRFIYLFQLTKKVFFCLFSKYGNFTTLFVKTNLNRFNYSSLVI